MEVVVGWLWGSYLLAQCCSSTLTGATCSPDGGNLGSKGSAAGDGAG